MRSRYNRSVLALAVAALALVLSSCALVDKLAGGHVVEPYTPTTPCEIARAESQSACAIGKDQTSAECQAAKAATAKACNEPLPPEPQCSLTLSRSCWHMPPPSEVWLWRGRDGATDYESPAAEPAAPVVPPVVPPVTPPAAGCSLDGVIDPAALEGIEPRPTIPAKLATDVNGVELAAGGCDNCVVGAYDPWVEKVAEGLRARGWCVGQRIHPDALAVSDPSDTSVNYAIHVHIAGGGAGRARWMPSAYVDAWRVKATAPVALSACGDPAPPALGRIKLECKPGREGVTVCDSTPLAYSPGGTFCASVGFFNADGVTGRLFCSPRPEGHPERLACEQVILGGPAPVFVWDGPADQFAIRDNPFTVEFTTGKGTVKACNADQKVCSEVKP
jgi:hypothetical protein